MLKTQSQTVVVGREEREDSLIKRVGKFLFFKTEWWETVSTNHIGNDIHIKTDREIRQIYLNGIPLTPSSNPK